jgi:predicted RNase H-like HicB family nuclease
MTRKWAEVRREKMADVIQAARRMVAHGERPLYRATVESDGEWFLVKAPDLPGAHAQVARRTDAADAIRDVIALIIEVPADAIDVNLVDAR